jgi:hypothetical protein
MDVAPANAPALQGLLGYLNFSTGRPDPRIRAQFFSLWQPAADAQSPLATIYQQLDQALTALHGAGQSAFQDVQQARSVLDLALRQLPLAYRRHHADLLFQLSDADLAQPGYLMRSLEAVLLQQGPWHETQRIVSGAMNQLNDYVGHRPIAVLESRPRGEPYDHERFCPVPLYFRGASVAPGRYASLVAPALELLRAAPARLQSDSCFEFERLDELAYDPRAYDHGHPADKRPNYRFGEWDPHQIDNKGFFRRFVVRQCVLDGLLDRVQNTKDIPREELLKEAATVLAGTILMASGISGAGPESYDSSVSLATLMPLIARYRDDYYAAQLAGTSGSHGERLRHEAQQTRQPFGGARQHINQYLTQQRAAQLQQRQLALVVAELGYPKAARRHAARVPAASLRLLAEIHIHLTACQMFTEQGKYGEAADRLSEAEAVLHSAIACGAMVDPWNILGFQGLYPLFAAREDSVPDRRIDELVQVIDRLLTSYTRLRSEAASTGDEALSLRLATKMAKLASWWDRFATTTVNDVRHVVGHEAAASADHMADALARWHQRGEAAADLAFWRQHLDRFLTAKSFAIVIEELLGKNDFRAAMGLLFNWLSQANQVPLQDGQFSFHALAVRWMLGLSRLAQSATGHGVAVEELVPRFIDHLEANAEDLWQVPRLERAAGSSERQSIKPDGEEDALFGAAYEGVTYRDSTDDGNEGELLGFEPRQEFELETQGAALDGRLQFLLTVAKLFHLGMRCLTRGPSQVHDEATKSILDAWLDRARRNYRDLLALMVAIHELPVPAPSGAYDSLVEFDRRNEIKHRLLSTAIATCLEWALTVGGLMGGVGSPNNPDEESDSGSESTEGRRPRWEPALLQLEQAMWKGNSGASRRILPRLLESFQHEPLLVTPLALGGNPRLVLRAGIALTLLRALAASLPRLGLLRETYSLLRVAQIMEREQKLEGPRITEFDRLFQIACHASLETAVETVHDEDALSTAERNNLLGRLIQPYLALWSDHTRTLRLSMLETVATEAEWDSLRDFIKRYGGELFHARFMTLANLRGILQRGVGAYLKYLEENPDQHAPFVSNVGAQKEGGSLIDDLDRRVPRATAEKHLQTVLQAIVENYEEYKDYNSNTAQSDYGENLHMLLDFLQLKAAYERQAWLIRPLGLVHEVLVQRGTEAAALWQEQVEGLTATVAQQYLARLEELEKKHGMRLRTIADRLKQRFVLPLALDRVCALLGPAYDQARSGAASGMPDGEALEQLEAALQPYLDAPTGSGLDVPQWLRRLHAALHRVELQRTAGSNLAENLLQVPRRPMPIEDFRSQLEDWPI